MQTRDNGIRKEPLLPVCLCVCAKTHVKLDGMKNSCRHDCAYDPFGPLSSLLVRDKSLPALRRVVSSLGFHMALKAITFLFWFSGTLMCVPLCCVGGPRKEGHKIPHGLGKHLSSSCFRTASWYQLKGLWSLVRTESNFNCHQYATVNMQWHNESRGKEMSCNSIPWGPFRNSYTKASCDNRSRDEMDPVASHPGAFVHSFHFFASFLVFAGSFALPASFGASSLLCFCILQIQFGPGQVLARLGWERVCSWEIYGSVRK